MPERFRIIGAARHEVDVEEFRELARQAIEASGREDMSPATWEPFAESLRFVGVGDGFGALGEAVSAAREELGGEPGVLYYLSLPPSAMAATVEALGEAGLGAGRPRDHREAVRHRPRLGPRAERAAALGLRGALHLPDRPLPRPRGGAEPAGAALRQRHVRAGLEPQPHRPRPDRHPGDALDRDAGQLLRGNRRLPRHGRHPPLPGARLRRDGAADLAGAEGARHRAREGLRLDAAAAPGERGPRPVRRLPRGGAGSRPTPRPRPSSRSRPSSTTGAGRACRSTCAPASAWPRAGTC